MSKCECGCNPGRSFFLCISRARLTYTSSFAQLRTFHPHLEPLTNLFASYSPSSDSSTTLLVAIVSYLSSLSLPNDSQIKRLRAILTPYICRLRDAVLLKLPKNFQTLQALELMSVHAPLGVLPLQLTTLRTLAVARGQTLAACHISTELSFPRLIEQLLMPPGLRYSFECGDLWLWFGLCAGEAAATLEDLVPRKPQHLSEARRLADTFTNTRENVELWRESVHREDAALLVGRLAVCDKLARMEELLDALTRIRGALEMSATDPDVDPVQGIVGEFELFSTKMAEVDRRQDSIMGQCDRKCGMILDAD